MATRGFVGERMLVDGSGERVFFSASRLSAEAFGGTNTECFDLATDIAARWNACPEAFEKIANAVEDEDWIAVRDAALILRRAIYGESASGRRHRD